ncbi:MAG TPA: AraC family transcriptional regulator [Candidatus Competibacteraceae bacterium]|nr:AraC family transcriptional regulator [Candidatus Competibacteraceae bacterium]MCP5133152.1 AraC family transcriptional regulator [Gammaproteobacteria bacterium]HPF60185.1 AraC family transcriptional regulator [Candidatus Competibacteraceae bacterium]HRY19590.1 AraC family transcriptional regulator [Candidatus Competibacteraceae bacterium]
MPPLNENRGAFSKAGDNNDRPDREDLKKLAVLIDKFAPHDGRFDLSGHSLHVVKETKTTAETTHTLSQPGMCIVAQGAKRVSLTQHVYDYNESRMVVYAAEVPICARITEASPEEPFLCLVVQLDPQKLIDLIMKVFPRGVPKTLNTQAIYAGNSHPKIVIAAIRILELIVQQEDADLLVPLVMDEILIRLLRSPAGPSIAQIGITDSHAQKISRAIAWLKKNYTEPVKVEDLAGISGMSPSSFYSHFKSITSMSPLQFQKTLRLQEARNLMMTRKADVSRASFQVGYASLSQFSREYSRLFGSSPSQDIAQFRSA